MTQPNDSTSSTPAPKRPKVSLTGIKPTGEPHLGNYVGAIRPALELAAEYESWYFIADYHALTSVRDPKLLRHYTRSVGASWVAAGLDATKTVFYRQSDLPEIFEMTWALSCLTAKGLMNRAHAYKAARDRNQELGREDLDAGVNMGLYSYPVLMAVDILIVSADVVPVGKDQVQHVEIAADIAGTFNHLYGKKFKLKIPRALTPESESGMTLPGTDGRKMSKSYENTIPLFAEDGEIKKIVRRIPTDSTGVGEPKNPDASIPFRILEHFGSPETIAMARRELESGSMGWGDLKNLLIEALSTHLGPMRERYQQLMAPGSELDGLLAAGAERARERARPMLASIRDAVGI